MDTQATLTFNIGKDSVLNLFERIVGELPDDTTQLLDDLGETYKEFMEFEAPAISFDLINNIIVEMLGTYDRYIYSTVSYFDDVVAGHDVYGPIFSDKQRAWWFWYLKNVLGGEYTNKTDGHKEGNNFPTRAYYDAQSTIDAQISRYLENIGRG